MPAVRFWLAATDLLELVAPFGSGTGVVVDVGGSGEVVVVLRDFIHPLSPAVPANVVDRASLTENVFREDPVGPRYIDEIGVLTVPTPFGLLLDGFAAAVGGELGVIAMYCM